MLGAEPRRSSTHALHSRPASTTASDQSPAPACGHRTPAGGENAKRNASERSSSTLVSANTSGGHASNSSVNPVPLTPSHADASVNRSAPGPLCPAIIPLGAPGTSSVDAVIPDSTTARLLSFAERAERIAALQLTLQPALVPPRRQLARKKCRKKVKLLPV